MRDLAQQLERAGARFVAPDDLGAVLPRLTSAVLSPGIPLNGDLVRRVQDARVPVYSEIEVAYRLCKAPIVAVTGTKGKSTTTALIGAEFRRAGKTTHVGGNIGNALIDEIFDAEPDDWVVAEVSSFQLESIRSFKPRVAVILNLAPDHLDRYHSMDEYAEAKFRIFANQGPGDTFVGNLDDPLIGQLAEGEQAAHSVARALVRNESAAHDDALRAPRAHHVRAADRRSAPGRDDAGFGNSAAGRHNVQNVMAALLVGLAAGLDPEALRAAVREFEPLPHRLQRSPKSTACSTSTIRSRPIPARWSPRCVSFDRPIVLIAGGKSKGTDFARWGCRAARTSRRSC